MLIRVTIEYSLDLSLAQVIDVLRPAIHQMHALYPTSDVHTEWEQGQREEGGAFRRVSLFLSDPQHPVDGSRLVVHEPTARLPRRKSSVPRRTSRRRR